MEAHNACLLLLVIYRAFFQKVVLCVGSNRIFVKFSAQNWSKSFEGELPLKCMSCPIFNVNAFWKKIFVWNLMQHVMGQMVNCQLKTVGGYLVYVYLCKMLVWIVYISSGSLYPFMSSSFLFLSVWQSLLVSLLHFRLMPKALGELDSYHLILIFWVCIMIYKKYIYY